jgi:chromosome partitioning protein
MRVIVVANLKGGSTKTTSSAFLAHAWHERGRRILGVDADPAGSLLRWSEMAGWPFPVIGLPVRDLHVRLPAIAHDYELIVVDTPPLDDRAGIVYGALRAADDVVIPVSPTTMELDRLAPVLSAIEEVAPLRAVPSRVAVLLTRVVASAASGRVARDVIAGDGLEVLPTAVPRLERYAQAFGEPVHLALGDPYGLAADELLAEVVAR